MTFLCKRCSLLPCHFCSKLCFSTFQVFPIGSPLVPDVSRAILNVTEGQKMVEIERTWLGDTNKCPDSNTLLPPNNLGLGSFWGLFAIAGVAGLIALAICIFRFLHKKHERQGVIFNPQATLLRNIIVLVKEFVCEDFSGKDHRCFCDCMRTPMHRNNQPHERREDENQETELLNARRN